MKALIVVEVFKIIKLWHAKCYVWTEKGKKTNKEENIIAHARAGISHFRLSPFACLCFKTSPGAKPFQWKWTCEYFHIKGFAPGLVLTQKQNIYALNSRHPALMTGVLTKINLQTLWMKHITFTWRISM